MVPAAYKMTKKELTERHLVDEAEVTLHHLGPGQLRRRVHSYPVETIRLHGVPVKSWVIGGWSLNRKKESTSSRGSNEWRNTITIYGCYMKASGVPQTHLQW